ncbi:Mrp/NBP35 family ATP-binding protein [Anaerorudis cellulosivorans]|uniref:Mrp/NBP35 family ATP-binding protein n=1 Tax=Anaerorudis cellulosivorans TaxID=3397862 RepID=UPI0029F480D4|nr:Mrp/NBP35 family ATP-binding protein [Seramator thermalis]
MEQLKALNKSPFEKIMIPSIKNMIMVSSGKGGVGKSTVAAGIALSLAKKGYSVGLMDADIYGPSVPTLFNLKDERPVTIELDGKTKIEPFIRFGIKVNSLGFLIDPMQAVLWRGPMASNAIKQLMNDTHWGELDFLIIDTPPGTGDIHLTFLQQFEITGTIIVTTPQLVALDDVQKTISMFKNERVGVPVLGIVENMAWFTPSKHPEEKYFLFGRGGGEKLSKIFNVPLIAQIPINENICQSCDEGKLDILFDDDEVKTAFSNLTDALLDQLKTKA